MVIGVRRNSIRGLPRVNPLQVIDTLLLVCTWFHSIENQWVLYQVLGNLKNFQLKSKSITY